MRTLLMIMLICMTCAGCTGRDFINQQRKLAYYSLYSKNHLINDFKRAGIAYPPKRLALLIFKQSKRIQVYAGDHGQWRFIKTLPIKAASGDLGPKLSEGDHQVPEGIYHITALNPNSHFLLSMKLDYPNAFDREIAQTTHRRRLGDDIFIHGKAQSVGCIAIGDEGIKQLFPLVAEVGIQHVQVIIAPNDLRYKNPAYRKIHPHWLFALYQKLRLALSNFPLHSSL